MCKAIPPFSISTLLQVVTQMVEVRGNMTASETNQVEPGNAAP
jgi:hypothetical protein